MPADVKLSFLSDLAKKCGAYKRLQHSQSLFETVSGKTRIYVRYSKKHPGNRTFFGLRQVDLNQLEGQPSLLCFLWDDQKQPLFVPFAEFEEVFRSTQPAQDGQYKVQVYEEPEGTELYIAGAGRFNVESYFGWQRIDDLIGESSLHIPTLSHSDVQWLLASIGFSKGYDIWIPDNNRGKLESQAQIVLSDYLPSCLQPVRTIAEEIDVVWIERGTAIPRAFFEVEHSTPIYSGLLRFNDVHLLLPRINSKFGIVSNEDRRSLFVRQVARPTFKSSGLSERCLFFEYRNVYGWHRRLKMKETEDGSD